MERRSTCIHKDVLKDDMLPLLNPDSDWDLVESDDEDECIFPYSPSASVMRAPRVAQNLPVHGGQTKPSTEPPQNLTSIVPRPSSQ